MLLSFAAACTSGQESDECVPCRQSRTVAVELRGQLPVSGLETPLCVFRRSTGSQDEYRLAASYTSVADGETLKLPLAELEAYDYRFLMLAQPAEGKWLTMQMPDGGPFVPGAGWTDLRLASATGAAQIDGYGGFTDMTGAEILARGTVSLTLTRIAGQLLFDFYRIGTSLSDPVGVVSADVESVLDRVSKIEIEYDRPTTALRFDAEGKLVPAAYASAPLRQTVTPAMEQFKITLPQADRGLAQYDAQLRGSLRMQGEALLPSDGQLRVRMTFTYYDTTPACGNNHEGGHVAECFTLRQVTLALPAASSLSGLPVAADCYTVNRAGLRCDRIIDIPVGGDLEADFGWM